MTVSPLKTASDIPPTVSFNVGGTLFSTSRTTLHKEPTSRLSLLVKGTLPSVKDAQGSIFVDRDPKHFHLILNYLRDGWCLLPSASDQRQELLHEVRFYQLKSFEAWIRSQELPAGVSQSLSGSPLHVRTRQGSSISPGRGVNSPMLVNMTDYAATYQGADASHAVTTTGMHHLSSSYRAAPSYSSMYSSMAHVGSPTRVYAPLSSAPSPVNTGTGGNNRETVRESLMRATLPGPIPHPSPAYSLPQHLDADKWTAKYLSTNGELRGVVDTLLELAFLHPHRTMHAGKISISISTVCDHDQASSLLGGVQEQLRNKIQTIRSSGSNWSFEFTIRPGGDPTLFSKYNIVDVLQDNWFVLLAILKDQFGVLLEEDTSRRPQCLACRRTNAALLLTKIT